jgi:hypothetical protein
LATIRNAKGVSKVRTPLRVFWSKRSHSVQRESELEVKGLLGPERAVIVERRDPGLRRKVMGARLGSHASDEIDNCSLRSPVVPGRKWLVSI